MSTSSNQADQILGGASRPGPAGGVRPATGEYARFRELALQDSDLTDDEMDEFEDLIAKRRAGKLGGRPTRTVVKRESIAGDGDRDGTARSRRPNPSSSEAQAALLTRGRD